MSIFGVSWPDSRPSVGDTALADSLDRWLAAQPVARVSWTASIYRARVAALLGRRDDAVARTREAFDEGAWPRWLHQEPELASAAGPSRLRRADGAAGLRGSDRLARSLMAA